MTDYVFTQIANGLTAGMIYSLIALGFSLVYGVMKRFNFAHSEVFMGSMYVAWWIANYARGADGMVHGVKSVVALVAAMLAGGGLALAVERIAYRPFRSAPKFSALLSAIAISAIMQNVARQIFGPETQAFPVFSCSQFPRLTVALILAACYLPTMILIERSGAGIRIRAVADDEGAARLCGINPISTTRLAFMWGGVLAGAAGFCWGVLYGTVNPQVGFVPGLKCFMIAVIGTIGSLPGTFAAAMCFGLVEALTSAVIPSEYSGFSQAFIFLLLAVGLIWRPTGIFRFGRSQRLEH
jgi:branched-chain amino acid transport system permease protein